MAEDMKIEIPLDFKGGEGNDELNKNIKKLDRTMYLNVDVIEMLSSLLGDVYKLVQPLFKMLSILLLVFFIPFIPLLKLLMEKIGELISWIFESGAIESMTKFVEKVSEILGVIIDKISGGIIWVIQTITKGVMALFNGLVWIGENILRPVLEAIVWVFQMAWKGLKFYWNLWKSVFLLIWEGLKFYWNLWKSVFLLIWEGLKWVWDVLLEPIFTWLAEMFRTIWENFIKPPFEFLKDVGSWIWDIISAPFRWLAGKVKSISSWFKKGRSKSVDDAISDSVGDAIISPNGKIITTNPNDYLIATKDPKSLGGGTTININNPIVREDKDIKKVADEVSKVLERKLWRSY